MRKSDKHLSYKIKKIDKINWFSTFVDKKTDEKIVFTKFPLKVVVGILKGLDQVVNVVLSNTEERVFTPDGVDRQPLGLYLIRGDNVAVIGMRLFRKEI